MYIHYHSDFVNSIASGFQILSVETCSVFFNLPRRADFTSFSLIYSETYLKHNYLLHVHDTFCGISVHILQQFVIK